MSDGSNCWNCGKDHLDGPVPIARGSYSIVRVPGSFEWHEFLEDQGLIGSNHPHGERMYENWETGLDVRIHGKSIEPSRSDYPYLSYVDFSGPVPAVESFVSGLLDLSTGIKYELRAPGLTDFEDVHDPVPDCDRVVSRDKSAAVVSRMADSDGDFSGGEL